MIITTTNEIQGRAISSYEGIVTGEAIVGAHIFKDIFAGVRDFFGGRSRSYENTIRDAKNMALEDLKQQALERGADAVVAIDFEYQVLGSKGSMLMASVSGTAVKLS